MNIERDPADWLIEQELAGRSQYDIAEELSKHLRKPDGSPDDIAQTTIGRSIKRLRLGQDITGKVRRAIRARFIYETKLDARADADQAAFLELMNALDEWQAFNAYEAEQALAAQKRRVAAESAFRARQEEVRARARNVNRWMQDLGIVEKGNTYVYADGASLIKEGTLHFRYGDTKAEIVGYSPREARLPDGRTVAELREGVTRERRMRPSAVPAGHPRPEMIGIRSASLIPRVPYFDGEWFWGRLHADISAWCELRDAAPGWWKIEREFPTSPTGDDVSWYRQMLDIETKLLESGLSFEESVLGWRDDWAVEAEEKRAALHDLERRRERIETTAARRRTALKIAAWGTAAIAAIGLLWLIVIPLVLWVFRGIAGGIRAAVGAVVAFYDGAARAIAGFGDWMGQALETAVTSPTAFIVLALITLLLVAILPSGRRGQEIPAYPWVLGAAAFFGVLTAITGVMWASHLLSPLFEVIAANAP